MTTRLMTMQVTIDELCLIERLRNVRNECLKSGEKYAIIVIEVMADGTLGWRKGGKREQANYEKYHHPGYKIRQPE